MNLATNVDHVPSKSFLRDPRPENLPTVPVCTPCNNGFSKDEAYMVASLSAAITGTTDPTKQVIPSARRILEKSEALQTAIKRSSSYTTIGGDRRLVWKPDIERIKRVVVKNARGHAFFEMGEPMMGEPASVRIIPLEYMTAGDREEFETLANPMDVFPEVGSRMMTRVLTGQDLTDDGWILVQGGVYRYVAVQIGLMTVRSVLYEYLATEVRWDN
ncbi:hypothetical protein UNPF46_36005 [Bradyrhizobium sp. UNPF46]|nr:hypothetical protein UNPF46_36005 [Bradyrhizobium sp. UNPF46]